MNSGTVVQLKEDLASIEREMNQSTYKMIEDFRRKYGVEIHIEIVDLKTDPFHLSFKGTSKPYQI